MDLKIFESLVANYLENKTNENFELILLSLQPYLITIIKNLNLKDQTFDDIKQELEFKIFTALNSYNPNSNRAWGYITKSIKNRAYELYKKNNKFSLFEFSYIDNLDTPVHSVDHNFLNEYLSKDLSKLQVDILYYCYIKDFSLSDIAYKLKKSKSCIVKNKKIALSILKKNFF